MPTREECRNCCSKKWRAHGYYERGSTKLRVSLRETVGALREAQLGYTIRIPLRMATGTRGGTTWRHLRPPDWRNTAGNVRRHSRYPLGFVPRRQNTLEPKQNHPIDMLAHVHGGSTVCKNS